MNKKTINKLITDKVDRLVGLSLNNGVQLEDLVQNIYEMPYESVNVCKNNNQIQAVLLFKEQDECKCGKTNEVIYIYSYSLDKVLLRVESIINNCKNLEWDRHQIETDLISEIIDLLKSNHLECELNRFIKSLPSNLKRKIMALVA